ncbi:hypothetical protein [Nannocystis bainbridge]|uniref:Uncharacterized protein n=1 Tax=Nannocystis bainbridge TaxID=2995303 RepID=A0ABT5E6X1_9BACT|nr:hypothetical protein [Nannocystis bainbridge]MDC0720663.1 hypothetical protein [Nannocystis bainbridge]
MNKPKRPKPARWADMADGERLQILNELSEGGFGSELRARKIFANEGFESWAFYYLDRDGANGGTTREVDIFAQRIGGLKDAREFHHQIVGEVKSGYIWILGDKLPPDMFDPRGTIESELPEWFDRELAKIPVGGAHPRDTKGDVLALDDAFCGMSLVPQHLSTSIHQHRTDKAADAWFEAAVKVAKASAEIQPLCVVEGDKKTEVRIFAVVVPLIVLDGNLLAAVDGPDGLKLEPVDHALVRFTVGSAHYPEKDTFVHVVTMDGLPSFLRKVMAAEIDASQRALRFLAAVR